ncbi:hypothetical protein RI367_004129 [Sorochytrium milnesiophthora]
MSADANLQPYVANVQNIFRPQSVPSRPPSTPAHPSPAYRGSRASSPAPAIPPSPTPGSRAGTASGSAPPRPVASPPIVAVKGRSFSRGSNESLAGTPQSPPRKGKRKTIRVVLRKRDAQQSASVLRHHTPLCDQAARLMSDSDMSESGQGNLTSRAGSKSLLSSSSSSRRRGHAKTSAASGKHELIVGRPTAGLKEMAERLLQAKQDTVRVMWRPMRARMANKNARKRRREENLRVEIITYTHQLREMVARYNDISVVNQRLRSEHHKLFHDLNSGMDHLLEELASMDSYISTVFKHQAREQKAHKRQHEATLSGLKKVAEDLTRRRDKMQRDLDNIEKTVNDLHQLKHDMQNDPNHVATLIEPYVQNRENMIKEFALQQQAVERRIEAITGHGRSFIEDQLRDIIDAEANPRINEHIDRYLRPIYGIHLKLSADLNHHHTEQASLEQELQALQANLDALESEHPDRIALEEHSKRYGQATPAVREDAFQTRKGKRRPPPKAPTGRQQVVDPASKLPALPASKPQMQE